MFPSNPRELRRRMKQLGIDAEELNGVRSVAIELQDKEIIIRDAQVVIMKLQGQKMYYVSGGAEEVVDKEVRVEAPSISEDDIKFVMEQTGASRDEALNALRKAGGDIPQAILILTEK
ncbi:MAG: nascent polypeptide-associated complex protein [Zestosphaera sp.]